MAKMTPDAIGGHLTASGRTLNRCFRCLEEDRFRHGRAAHNRTVAGDREHCACASFSRWLLEDSLNPCAD